MRKLSVTALLLMLTLCFNYKLEANSSLQKSISIIFFGRLQVPFKRVSLEQNSKKCLLKIDQKSFNKKMNVCFNFFKKNHNLLKNKPPIPDIVIPTVMYGEVTIRDSASKRNWKRITKLISNSSCNSEGKCKKANITPIRKATFDLIKLAKKKK